MLTNYFSGSCYWLYLSIAAVFASHWEFCTDHVISAFIDPAGNILRYMTSLLGCPVSLAHSRALPQCAFCGRNFCRLGYRLPGNSLRPVGDRSQSRSLTLRQRHTMSHSPTVVHVSNSSTQPQPSGQDLLVVGPGVLGSYVGILWQKQHPSATVVGQTNSTANHDR